MPAKAYDGRVLVGILGGSFDPIHMGHEALARAALGVVDHVMFNVAAHPPHKQPCVAPFADRVAMARLVADRDPRFGVSDIEGRREGPSYTFYSVTELSRQRPDDRFALIVGADMLADLPRWHRAHELVALVEVVAVARPGIDAKQAEEAFLGAFDGRTLRWLEFEITKASSTEARRRLGRGEGVEGLLDPAVEGYIRERGLYFPG